MRPRRTRASGRPREWASFARHEAHGDDATGGTDVPEHGGGHGVRGGTGRADRRTGAGAGHDAPGSALGAQGQRGRRRAVPGAFGGQQEHRVGGRYGGHGAAHDRRRGELAERLAARRGRPPVPGHRGVRRAARGRPGDRRGRDVPRLPHRRRRSDLDGVLPQHRRERLLRLHDLLRQPARSRDERPGGRQVPHPVHRRRRPFLEGAVERRDAGRARRRGGLRGERAVPGEFGAP